MMGVIPTVSVVIPTYHRPELLKLCIQALLSQEGVSGAIEILVVDDARSNGQKAELEIYANHPGPNRVRYLQTAGAAHGPAAARNTGWRAAQGEIIAFTDDDTIPDRQWLSHGLRVMQPSIDAAWGHVIVPVSGAPTDAERNVAGLHGAEFITANCFVRRSALVLVNGFDERFERPWREDSDLQFMLLEAGCTIVAAPAAIVIHPARPAPPATSIRQHRNLLFEALLYKKHPLLYRERIAHGPPWRYYAIVLMALLTVAGLFAGQAMFSAAAAAIWLLLTLRLTLRRLRGTSTAWLNVADIVFSSAIIPVVAVFWRLAGAFHFRVRFT